MHGTDTRVIVLYSCLPTGSDHGPNPQGSEVAPVLAPAPEKLPLPAGRLPDSPSPARGRALVVEPI